MTVGWLRRIFGWNPRQERAFSEELEAHRAMIEEELQRSGLSLSEARVESRRRMGNVVLARESVREAWIPRSLHALHQDVTYALRQFLRAPAFSVVIVATLALGIGGTTAAFSVVCGILWRPLPYPHPDRLVELFEQAPTGGAFSRASGPNYLFWTARIQRLDAIAAFRSDGITMTGDQEPEYLNASVVTPSFFDVLSVPPIVGRVLEPADAGYRTSRVVVLGESFWRARFGADMAVVGRAVTLDGERYFVVGVVPPSVREVGRSQAAGAGDTDVFLPLTINPQENRGNHTLRVIGRLRPQVALAEARQELRMVAAELAQTFPETNANWSVRAERLDDTTIEPPVRRSLVFVLGAIVLVFFIACTNIANLLLVRGIQRRAELALRVAIGAGRLRLIRQLLTESVVFAGVGGVIGVGLAFAAHPLILEALPSSLPRVNELRLDLSVVAFGVALSGLSIVAFGVIPAVVATRLHLRPTLTTAARIAANPAGRWRETLLVAQIALATVLSAGAGLLGQTLVRLQQVPLGFEPMGIVTARLSLPSTRYTDAASAGRFYADLLVALQRSGDTDAAAIGTSVPFGPGVRAAVPLTPSDAAATPEAGSDERIAAEHMVSGNYFRVLGIPVLAGRTFDDRDDARSAAVTILSQAAARVLWPGANPIGRTLTRAGRQFEVIGIVGDVRGSDVRGLRGGGADVAPRPAIYVASSQSPQRTMSVVIRARTSGGGAVRALRATVRALDTALPLRQVEALEQSVVASVAPVRTTTAMTAVFSGSALFLMSIGIYGALAFGVRQRTHEIGIRMSLGATGGQVRLAILRRALAVLGVGLGLGLSGAAAVALALSSQLFETNPLNVSMYVTIAAVIALTVVLAAWLPAQRAATVDPIKALRQE